MTSLEISLSARIAELLEFGAGVERAIVSEDSILDELMLVFEGNFKVDLVDDHF